MNVENILRVADAIEQHSIPDLGFNMDWLRSQRVIVLGSGVKAWVKKDHTGEDCGTIACIAGWACAVAGIERPSFADAAFFLGINPDAPERDGLFYAEGSSYADRLKAITVPHAVAVLRHLAATGIVDWTIGSPALSTKGVDE